MMRSYQIIAFSYQALKYLLYYTERGEYIPNGLQLRAGNETFLFYYRIRDFAGALSREHLCKIIISTAMAG